MLLLYLFCFFYCICLPFPLEQVIAEGFKYLPDLVKEVVMNFLKFGFKEELFMKRPVHEVLFGFDDEALKQLMLLLPSWFDRSKIGYFIRVSCFILVLFDKKLYKNYWIFIFLNYVIDELSILQLEATKSVEGEIRYADERK